jgi:hypothetical protein
MYIEAMKAAEARREEFLSEVNSLKKTYLLPSKKAIYTPNIKA